MRVTIVSDVHANLAALEAVLRHAQAQGATGEVWSLGDLVGYGPQPSACLARLREFQFSSVAGNHDLAAAGVIDTREFNKAAAAANRWNAEHLADEERAFLGALPLLLDAEGTEIAHGSLRSPVWEYMITIEAAVAQLKAMRTSLSLVGHTHVPLVFEEDAEHEELAYWRPEDGEALTLGERRLIVNPGSVGQPRDGDPRAAYALLDTDTRTFTFHRVPYDVGATQRLITSARLPASLAKRLAVGR